MRAARCEAGPVTSIFSTSCPPPRKAPAMASTVSTVSNSASSSLSVRRRLWVNAIFTVARSRAQYDSTKSDPPPSTEKDAASAVQRAGHLLCQLLEVLARADQIRVDAELER